MESNRLISANKPLNEIESEHHLNFTGSLDRSRCNDESYHQNYTSYNQNSISKINTALITTEFRTTLAATIANADWAQVTGLAEQAMGSPQLQVSDAEMLDCLLQALEWGDFQVRWEVAKLLPKLGPIAIDPLLQRLQVEAHAELAEESDENFDEEMQWFIIRMLGAWEQDSVLQALWKVLESGNSELQAMAATVLAQSGDRVLPQLKAIVLDPNQEQSRARLWSAKILAHIRTVETIDLLLILAMDQDIEICGVAIEALGCFQDDRIAAVLSHNLQSVNANLRQTAAEAIAFCQALSPDRRIELLSPLLWDLNVSVTVQAAASLGRLGPGATEPLLKALESQPLPDTLGIELVRSLLRIETPLALAGLFTSILHSPQSAPLLRHELWQGLGRVQHLKPMCVSYCLQLLAEEKLTLDDRNRLVTTLGHLAQPAAIDDLIAQLKIPDTKLRLHVLQALQQIDRTLERPLIREQIASQLQDLDPSLEPSSEQCIEPSSELRQHWRSGLEFAIAEWR